MAESQPVPFDSLRQQMIEQIRIYAGLVRDETGTACIDASSALCPTATTSAISAWTGSRRATR